MQEIESTATLNDRDARIVTLTVAGRTATEVAAELGVSVHTGYRRLKLPHVRLAITDARSGDVRALAAQARGEVAKSVQTLAAMRDNAELRADVRVRAATALLGWWKDVWEMGEVLPRIAAVEAQLAGLHGAGASPAFETASHVGRGDVPPGLVVDDEDTELA